MKSLVLNIRGYFNKRTKLKDTGKDADATRRTLVIENGEKAGRLMANEDFALMFNLYRFNMLERLEDSKDDSDRISNAHYVAGVRDFIYFVEQQEYLGKVAIKANL
jgi:Mg/Co/Ni transporter MgtE